MKKIWPKNHDWKTSIINIDGLNIKIKNEVPNKGDLYIAERNIGPELLTAKEIDYKNNWIVPIEKAYLYNLSECKKVIKIIE